MRGFPLRRWWATWSQDLSQGGVHPFPTTSALPDPTLPNGIIAFHWADMNPGNLLNEVFYGVRGNAPNRFWCVRFIDPNGGVSMRGPNPGTIDPNREAIVQCELQETTNDIFLYIAQWCANTSGNLTTFGIEDYNGTFGTQYARFGSPPDQANPFRAVRFTQTDVIPPARTTNLTGSAVATCPPRVQLSWTAPGDDGTAGGSATSYQIRMGTTGPITEANFAAATLLNPAPPFPSPPVPAPSGTTQTYTATGLAPLASYWFAIVAFDTVPNPGPVSNSPEGVTQAGSFGGVGGSAGGGGISNNAGASDQPRLCRDPAGTLFAVWQDNSGGNFEVYARRFDGVSNTTGASTYPACAVRGTSDFFVAWADLTPGQYEVYVSTIPIVDTTDGADEVLVGVGAGGNGQSQVIDDAAARYVPLLPLRQMPFAGYNAANGAVHLAMGDINNDGLDEVILGIGTYPPSSAAWPAAGDVDGDGRAEAVVGVERGGSGLFFVFDDQVGGFLRKTGGRMFWSAYSAAQGEVRPAVGDFDGDLRDEVALTTGVYPSAGGFVEFLEDQILGFRNVAWRRYGGAGYWAVNGELFPAAGNCR